MREWRVDGCGTCNVTGSKFNTCIVMEDSYDTNTVMWNRSGICTLGTNVCAAVYTVFNIFPSCSTLFYVHHLSILLLLLRTLTRNVKLRRKEKVAINIPSKYDYNTLFIYHT